MLCAVLPGSINNTFVAPSADTAQPPLHNGQRILQAADQVWPLLEIQASALRLVNHDTIQRMQEEILDTISNVLLIFDSHGPYINQAGAIELSFAQNLMETHGDGLPNFLDMVVDGANPQGEYECSTPAAQSRSGRNGNDLVVSNVVVFHRPQHLTKTIKQVMIRSVT